MFRLSTFAGSIVALLVASPFVRAANHYFDGSGSGWEVPSNWSLVPDASDPDPLTAPGVLDRVIFNITALNSPQFVHLNGGRSTLGLTVNSPGGATLLGGTQNSNLAIGTGGITLAPNAGSLNIGSATAGAQVGIVLLGSQSWTNNSGPASPSAMTILNGISAGGGSHVSLTLGANTPFTVSNTISGGISDGGGSIALTVNAGDTGRWRLDGANTYTGETIVQSGALAIKGSAALGSTTGVTRVSAGGALLLDTVGALSSETIYLAGNGPASAPFGALQSIAGSAILSTAIFVDTGTSSSSIGAINGSTLSIHAPITAAGTGALVFQITPTATTSGGIHINANVSHPGQTITVRSNDFPNPRVTLSGQNDYGDTIIESGTLQLGFNDATGNLGTGAISIGTYGTLRIPENDDLVVSNAISGGGSFEHSGRGTITLTAANNLTGRTSITRGGTLNLDFRNLASPTNQAGTAGLTLAGGKLNIIGNSSGITSQIFGHTTLEAGASHLAIHSNGGTATNVGLGLLSRSVLGGTLVIAPPTNGFVTTTSTNSNEILGGHVIVGTSDWAANDGTGRIVPFSGYETNLGASGNLDVPAGGGTLTGTPNTIRFNEHSASALVLGVDTTINSSGILVTPNVGTRVSQISGTVPLKSPPGQDLIVFQNNLDAALVINAPIGSDLTKVGEGLLSLTAASTTAFSTRISQGTLSVSAPALLGTSASGIIFQNGGSGVLQLTGNNTFDSAKIITLNGDAIIDVPVMATLRSSVFSSSTNVNFTKTGDGTLIISSNGMAVYTGATILRGGILQISRLEAALGMSPDTVSAEHLIIDGATLRFFEAPNIGVTNRLFSLGVGSGTIDASGGNGRPLQFTNTGAIAFTDLNTSLRLTLTGTSTGANIMSPALGDNGTGATSLLKTGPGLWDLRGENSYSGGTTVAGGTLSVQATSSLGLGDVAVLSTANRLIIRSSNSIAATATLSLEGDGVLNGQATSGYLSLDERVHGTTVSGLILGGVSQTELGTYGSTASGANHIFDDYFQGSGKVTLIPEPATPLVLLSSAWMLTCSRRRGGRKKAALQQQKPKAGNSPLKRRATPLQAVPTSRDPLTREPRLTYLPKKQKREPRNDPEGGQSR